MVSRLRSFSAIYAVLYHRHRGDGGNPSKIERLLVARLHPVFAGIRPKPNNR
jgi:hypothetical protein